MGCVVFPGAIPDRIEDGIVGRGFPIEVHNVLGAGDAFMAGFLRGWLRGEPLETAATWANACGAFAVSRLLCSPEYPTWEELSLLPQARQPAPCAPQGRDAQPHPLGDDPPAAAGNADGARHRPSHPARGDGRPRRCPARAINAFKVLAVEAAAQGRRTGGQATACSSTRPMAARRFFAAASQPFWLGRPVEQPGSRPLRFEFDQDIGGRLAEWPVTHTVKCLAFFHPDDDPALKAEQTERLRTLYQAARRNGWNCSSRSSPASTARSTTRRSRRCSTGSTLPASSRTGGSSSRKPPPQHGTISAPSSQRPIPGAAASCCSASMRRRRSWRPRSRRAPSAPVVKGFAVGRTIFNDAAEKWLERKDRRQGGGRGHGGALRAPRPNVAGDARPCPSPKGEVPAERAGEGLRCMANSASLAAA